MGLLIKWIKIMVTVVIFGWALMFFGPLAILYWAQQHPDNGIISSPTAPGSISADTTHGIAGATGPSFATREEMNQWQNEQMWKRNHPDQQ